MMKLLGFILFYIGLILRFTYASTNEEFTAARYDFSIFIHTRTASMKYAVESSDENTFISL